MMLNGEQLPRSWMVKCLRVWIDVGLTWKKQVEAVGKNCFCGHAKLEKVKPGCTATYSRKVYCALVLSLSAWISYCSQECTKLACMAKEG